MPRRRHVGAHRLAWEIAHRLPVPEGMLVCHHCDNPPCCNPAHLFIGTKADNARDKVQKGRAHRLTGSKHPRTHLTEADITVIRARLAAGETQAALARHYEVNFRTINLIALRKSWAHVA